MNNGMTIGANRDKIRGRVDPVRSIKRKKGFGMMNMNKTFCNRTI